MNQEDDRLNLVFNDVMTLISMVSSRLDVVYTKDFDGGNFHQSTTNV